MVAKCYKPQIIYLPITNGEQIFILKIHIVLKIYMPFY